MSESLFSQSWYRVAPVRPKLRPHVRIHHHTYRGRDWYVLQDHATGRFHRFSHEAYLVIGLMDGRHTMDEIFKAACERLGDDMPTQDEIIQLLGQLHQADVLQAGVLPDTRELGRRAARRQRSEWLTYLRSPMAMRFPLVDPERFLTATQWLVRPFLGWAGLFVWLLLVVTAFVAGVVHFEELTTNLADRVLATENLLVLWLVYPLQKGLHELGHAYMVKRRGGEVHELGIMLLVLMPVPYVDASASSAFADKRDRVAVGAGGIIMDLLLAALAMFVWVSVEPSLLRAAAFNVILIGSVSTLLFNGNPLLRFDAYYILGDLIEIPNLGARGNRYLGYLFRTRLLGQKEVESPAGDRGEAAWLACYAVASFVYRIFITVRIVLFIAGRFFFIGVLLAVWALGAMVFTPLLKAVRSLAVDPALARMRGRTAAVVLGACVLVVVPLALVPFPSSTVVQGVIWPPEQAFVRAGVEGFVREVLVESGTLVEAGAPLVVCGNLDLEARVRVISGRLREYEAKRRVSLLSDRAEARMLEEEIEHLEAELAGARERMDELTLCASVHGVFVAERPRDLPGRFVRQGEGLGYVLDQRRSLVRAVVSEERIDLIRHDTREVRVRLSDDLKRDIRAQVLREVPLASRDLPSLALSVEGGGPIALDPRGSERPQAFRTLFQLDLALEGPSVLRVGQRVYVRFTHGAEPLAWRWWRDLRRLLLSRFSL
jgi:putative peptide zinc metalloprotease protein